MAASIKDNKVLYTYKRKLKLLGGRFFKLMLPYFPNYKGISIILVYHRVIKKMPECFNDNALFVTEETFEMHLDQLREHFEILPLTDVLQPSEGKRMCAITFDDGWIDNYEVAFPILKKYQIPATIFLPVALIGSSNVFWFQSICDLATKAVAQFKKGRFIEYFQNKIVSWKSKDINNDNIYSLITQIKTLPGHYIDDLIAGAYKKMGIKQTSDRLTLHWDEIAEMGHNNINFGPHGLNHYILPSVEFSIKKKEISDSIEILKKKGIPVSSIFSYPNGDWDDDCLDLLFEKGYNGAVTTRLGYNTRQTFPFLLNRIFLHEAISNAPSLFWCRIFQSFVAGAGPYVENYNYAMLRKGKTMVAYGQESDKISF